MPLCFYIGDIKIMHLFNRSINVRISLVERRKSMVLHSITLGAHEMIFQLLVNDFKEHQLRNIKFHIEIISLNPKVNDSRTNVLKPRSLSRVFMQSYTDRISISIPTSWRKWHRRIFYLYNKRHVGLINVCTLLFERPSYKSRTPLTFR